MRRISGLLLTSILALLLAEPVHGQPSWPQTWGGPGAAAGQSIAFDSGGNGYVGGSTTIFGAGGSDALIVKYAPSGTLLWAKTWGGSGDEGVYRIALGPDGYIYATGGTDSFGAGWFDVFLLKLDTNGNLIWGTTWGGSSFEQGYDLGFDQAGNIYVAAESYSNGNCAVILKFSPSGGQPIWSTSWKGPATYDSAYSLAVDSNFNVIIEGTSRDYSVYPNHNSVLIVKFDSSGNYQWSENWLTATPGQDQSGANHTLTTDSSGNIYLGFEHSGDCQNSTFSDCPFSETVLKLGPSGNFQWANTWGGAGYTTAGGVAFDMNGDLLVSGTAVGPPQVPFVLRYDAAGDFLSSTGWSDQGTTISGLGVTSAGAVGVVGTAQDNGGNWESTSARAGILPNSLVSNPYTVGTPTGQVSSLTNPTQSQTGPEGTGGVFVTSYALYGIDVSCSAGPISKAKADQLLLAGVQYAVVKAPQFSSGTPGCASGQIGLAQQQMYSLISAGIKTAAYCVLAFQTQCGATPCGGGETQVQRCVNTITAGKEYPVQLSQLGFIALDVEDENELGSTGAAVDVISDAVTAVTAAQQQPVIYTDRGQWDSITGSSSAFSNVPLWLAGNLPSLILSPPFDGWTTSLLLGKQYQTDKSLGGVSPVDLDVFDPSWFK
jgi:hypothetical protein